MTLLGRTVDHEPEYTPAILDPLPRVPMPNAAAMFGADRWTGYEFSWLDQYGKPQIAMLQFDVPADSPYLIESKSLKLYLNSYARRRLEKDEVVPNISADLSAAAGRSVNVNLIDVAAWHAFGTVGDDSSCIDDVELVDPDLTAIDPSLLRTDGAPVTECLSTHLFRSNCPVTGQPDWATVSLHYRGPRIDSVGLLRYWLSFRHVREFHEQCVERMYADIAQRCSPYWFAVQARFTRRGGLDIHPLRASALPLPWFGRSWRQ